MKPRLTEEQVRDLRLCYNLIDLDHGGSIDIDELDTAFKVTWPKHNNPNPNHPGACGNQLLMLQWTNKSGNIGSSGFLSGQGCC